MSVNTMNIATPGGGMEKYKLNNEVLGTNKMYQSILDDMRAKEDGYGLDRGKSVKKVFNKDQYRNGPHRSNSDVYRSQSPISLIDNADDLCDLIPPLSPNGFLGSDERLQNDLLEEICSDIGIKDTMDLDLYDVSRDTVLPTDDPLFGCDFKPFNAADYQQQNKSNNALYSDQNEYFRSPHEIYTDFPKISQTRGSLVGFQNGSVNCELRNGENQSNHGNQYHSNYGQQSFTGFQGQSSRMGNGQYEELNPSGSYMGYNNKSGCQSPRQQQRYYSIGYNPLHKSIQNQNIDNVQRNANSQNQQYLMPPTHVETGPGSPKIPGSPSVNKSPKHVTFSQDIKKDQCSNSLQKLESLTARIPSPGVTIDNQLKNVNSPRQSPCPSVPSPGQNFDEKVSTPSPLTLPDIGADVTRKDSHGIDHQLGTSLDEDQENRPPSVTIIEPPATDSVKGVSSRPTTKTVSVSGGWNPLHSVKLEPIENIQNSVKVLMNRSQITGNEKQPGPVVNYSSFNGGFGNAVNSIKNEPPVSSGQFQVPRTQFVSSQKAIVNSVPKIEQNPTQSSCSFAKQYQHRYGHQMAPQSNQFTQPYPMNNAPSCNVVNGWQGTHDYNPKIRKAGHSESSSPVKQHPKKQICRRPDYESVEYAGYQPKMNSFYNQESCAVDSTRNYGLADSGPRESPEPWKQMYNTNMMDAQKLQWRSNQAANQHHRSAADGGGMSRYPTSHQQQRPDVYRAPQINQSFQQNIQTNVYDCVDGNFKNSNNFNHSFPNSRQPMYATRHPNIPRQMPTSMIPGTNFHQNANSFCTKNTSETANHFHHNNPPMSNAYSDNGKSSFLTSTPQVNRTRAIYRPNSFNTNNPPTSLDLNHNALDGRTDEFKANQNIISMKPFPQNNVAYCQDQSSLHSVPDSCSQTSTGATYGSLQADNSSNFVLNDTSANFPIPPGGMTPQQTMLHQLVTSDRSKAFRSHPLFPLLRDLIIADMNFNTPSFPVRLILNLPTDFNRLLQNFLQRNKPVSNPCSDAVEGVIMDALKFAHQSLMEKIMSKKKELDDQPGSKPTSVIEDFCERFDRAVRNSLQQSDNGHSSGVKDDYRFSPAAGFNKKSDSGGDSASVKSKDSLSTTTSGRKHAVLPKEAVQIMLQWLREHRVNPYPNDDEKELLIHRTKLTISQINYWFTNARRRILPKWAAMESQGVDPIMAR